MEFSQQTDIYLYRTCAKELSEMNHFIKRVLIFFFFFLLLCFFTNGRLLDKKEELVVLYLLLVFVFMINWNFGFKISSGPRVRDKTLSCQCCIHVFSFRVM